MVSIADSQDAMIQQQKAVEELKGKVKELEEVIVANEGKLKEREDLLASKEDETRRKDEELNTKGEEIKVLQDELSRERIEKERETEAETLLAKQVSFKPEMTN